MRLVLRGVLAISVTYVGSRLGRGWVPWDDGPLGHTAERVLLGERPHRDFVDVAFYVAFVVVRTKASPLYGMGQPTAVLLSRTPPLPLTSDSALVAGLERHCRYAAEFGTYQLRWHS